MSDQLENWYSFLKKDGFDINNKSILEQLKSYYLYKFTLKENNHNVEFLDNVVTTLNISEKEYLQRNELPKGFLALFSKIIIRNIKNKKVEKQKNGWRIRFGDNNFYAYEFNNKIYIYDHYRETKAICLFFGYNVDNFAQGCYAHKKILENLNIYEQVIVVVPNLSEEDTNYLKLSFEVSLELKGINESKLRISETLKTFINLDLHNSVKFEEQSKSYHVKIIDSDEKDREIEKNDAKAKENISIKPINIITEGDGSTQETITENIIVNELKILDINQTITGTKIQIKKIDSQFMIPRGIDEKLVFCGRKTLSMRNLQYFLNSSSKNYKVFIFIFIISLFAFYIGKITLGVNRSTKKISDKKINKKNVKKVNTNNRLHKNNNLSFDNVKFSNNKKKDLKDNYDLVFKVINYDYSYYNQTITFRALLDVNCYNIIGFIQDYYDKNNSKKAFSVVKDKHLVLIFRDIKHSDHYKLLLYNKKSHIGLNLIDIAEKQYAKTVVTIKKYIDNKIKEFDKEASLIIKIGFKNKNKDKSKTSDVYRLRHINNYFIFYDKWSREINDKYKFILGLRNKTKVHFTDIDNIGQCLFHLQNYTYYLHNFLKYPRLAKNNKEKFFKSFVEFMIRYQILYGTSLNPFIKIHNQFQILNKNIKK